MNGVAGAQLIFQIVTLQTKYLNRHRQYSETVDGKCLASEAQIVETSAWIRKLGVQVIPVSRIFCYESFEPFSRTSVCRWKIMLLPAHKWHFKCVFTINNTYMYMKHANSWEKHGRHLLMGLLTDSGHALVVMYAGIVNSRFPLKSMAGKTFPAFPAHARPAKFYIAFILHEKGLEWSIG